MVSSKDINEINSLIVAQLAAEKHKTGIPIAKIDRDYREETGERIPYARLGFSKLSDYLKTVPGVEVTEMYNAHYVNFIGTEDSKHIVDLVAKQRYKNPRPPRRCTGYPKSSSYGHFTKSNKNISDNIMSLLRRYPNGLTRAELLQRLNYEYAVNESINTLNDHLKLLGTQIRIKDKLILENTRKKSDDSGSYRYCDRVDSSRNQTYDINFQSTYNNYRPYSNSVSDDLDFHNGFVDLDSDQIGTENDLTHEIKGSNCSDHYNTVIEQYFINNPDITSSYSQQNAAHESLVHPDNSENITNTNTNQREYIFSQNIDYVSTTLSERIKFRLEKLIQNCPRGIWCTKLPKLYEDEYKISLDWTNLGFQRLSDFTAHLSDIFHMVGPQPNGDFKLYNAKEPLPDDKPTTPSKKLTSASLYDVYGDVEIEPVPTSVPASLSKQLSPDDVITIQETVGQVLVTDLTTSNNVDRHENPMIEVEVVEAYSPSFFWVRLLKNKRKFNKMMASLGEYYNANYEKYAVPIIMLERGLNIACVFYGKWHRAIIKSVDPSCRVTVLFYDYGTVDKYPANEIFYLHRSFTALPAQAVPCGLYSVAPHEGDKWPKRVRDWFIQWVCEKSLWANIVEVDTEKNSMLVTLADTSGKDDFFINDWLIDKNMAKIKKTVCIRATNFLYERYLQCQDMKNSLNVKMLDFQNTRVTLTDDELRFLTSPLFRRIILFRKLVQASDVKNNHSKIHEICPTCGSRVSKLGQQNLKIDVELKNTELNSEEEYSIKLSFYKYNREKSFDKVNSWLQKHRMNNLKFLQRVEAHTIGNKHIDSYTEYPHDIEESISVNEEVVKDSSIIKNNNDQEKNDQANEFISKKLHCNDHSIAFKYDINVNVSNVRQGISSIIHDFLSADEKSNNETINFAQSRKKVEPINWDDMKKEWNRKAEQFDNHSIRSGAEFISNKKDNTEEYGSLKDHDENKYNNHSKKSKTKMKTNRKQKPKIKKKK